MRPDFTEGRHWLERPLPAWNLHIQSNWDHLACTHIESAARRLSSLSTFTDTTLNSLSSTSLMSLFFLYPKTPREQMFSVQVSLFIVMFPLPYITGFHIKVNHQRIQPHASRCHHCNNCHYCNVDFVLFHNVTCYTTSLSSCIHVNAI